MAKFQLNAGETVLKTGAAPAMGKSLGLVPGAFPGRGLLTNQRFVHFKRNPGVGGGLAGVAADLMGETINFEFPLSELQSLQKTFNFKSPGLVITTSDGKTHKLISNPAYGTLDVEMWFGAFQEAMKSYQNKTLMEGSNQTWTAQAAA